MSKFTASQSPPTAPSRSKEPVRDLDLEAQLERNLLEEDQEESEEMPLDILSLRQEEEEEEEGQEKEVVIPPRQSPPLKAKATRPSRPPAKATTNSAPTAKPKARSKAKAKEKALALEIEAEDLEFGQPTRPAKRMLPSPPSSGLALPGPSATVSSRPIMTPLDLIIASHKLNDVAPPPPPPPPPPQPASDSEEDWDEVQPAPAGELGVMAVDEDEDEEEIDMNAFEEELNQELGGSEASAPPPMSLNQFAGGVAEASQDEDDYTTSEDSDDD
jgi:neural Wiskott-Aldrich syndrome protein